MIVIASAVVIVAQIFLHSIPELQPVRQQSLRSVRIYVADLPLWYHCCCLLFWGSSPSNKEILLVFLAYSKIMRAFLSSLLFCSVWYKWQCIEAGYTIGLHRTWSVQGKWVKKGFHFFLQGFPEIHFFEGSCFLKQPKPDAGRKALNIESMHCIRKAREKAKCTFAFSHLLSFSSL